MGFDIDGARKAGYSDDEIADHLAAQQNFDIKGARKAGYSTADVLPRLLKATAAAPQPAVAPAPVGGSSLLDAGPSFESLAASPSPAPLESLKPSVSPPPAAPPAPAVQPQGRSMGVSFTPAPPPADPEGVLDRKGTGTYQPTAADRAASADWESLSPQGQEKALAAMRYETGLRNAPALSAPPERGFVERALDSTVRRPLDRSATGALLETAGDAARGVLKASNNLGQSAWGGVQAAADAVGADKLSELAGAGVRAADQNDARLTNKADPESLTSKVFESTFTSVPLVLGVPGAPIRAIMGQSAAQEYGQSRARGLDPNASAERAVYFGLAEGIGERFGLPQLQHLFARAAQQATGKELGHILADMLVKEQIGEQVTTALQSGYDKFGSYGQKPNATLSDYLNDVADTAKVTLGQSLLSGGLAGGVKRAARGNSNAHAMAGALDADIHETPEEALNRAIDASPYGIARQAGFHVDPPLATDSPLDRRKKTENLFRNAAATVGMSPAAVDAAVKAAQTRPLDQVAGFFQRFAKSARDQGLAGADLNAAVSDALGHGPLDAKPQLRQVPPEAFALLDDGTGLADETPVQAHGGEPSEGPGRTQATPAPAPAASFTTARGSTYAVNPDGTTTRDKAARPEHPGEEGPQPASVKTVYVTPEDVQALGEVQAKGGPGRSLAFDDATQQVGMRYLDGKDAGKIEGRTVVKFQTQPAVGLVPVEYWGDNKTIHFGNEITEVRGPAPTPTAVDEGAHAAATSPTNDLAEPTQAQKEAGNYQKGHVRIGGLDLAIENPQGSVRRGVDRDGKAWESTLASHYGYIKGTVGNDKDHVDAFVKPGTPPNYSGPVFVVDQVHPDNGKFDEHKVVIGAADEAEAEAIYRANYAKDWQGMAGITRLPMQAFKSWVRDGTKKQPLTDLPGAQTVTAEPAPAAAPAPAAPRFQTTTNADGTVLVHGTPAEIKQALPDFKGIAGKRGITYGKRSAQAVLQALEPSNEPKQPAQPQAAPAPEAQPAPATEGSPTAAGPAAEPAGIPAAGPAPAEAARVEDEKLKPIPPLKGKDLVGLTYDELDAMLERAVAHNREVSLAGIRRFMGGEQANTAEGWKNRQLDKWLSEHETAEMSDWMQARYVNEDLIKDFRNAVNDFEVENPEALGRSIAVKAKNIDEPGFFETPDGAAVQGALRFAKEQGWNLDDVLHGMRGRAFEHAGDNAPELFRRLFQEAKATKASAPAVKPKAEAAALPAPAKATSELKPRERLLEIAKRLGVTVNEAGSGFRAGDRSIDIPAADADPAVLGAVTPEHIFAHELGHAVMQRRGMSFKGFPQREMLKWVSNWPAWVDASKRFRPAIHSHLDPRIKAHAKKADEIVADAIGSVLLGESPESLIIGRVAGLTRRDLGLEGPAAKSEEVAIPVPDKAAAPAIKVGTTPNSAEPVTVRKGVVHIGDYEAIHFETGEPIKVGDDASAADIKQALVDGGALGRRQKVYMADSEGRMSIAAVGEKSRTTVNEISTDPDAVRIAARVQGFIDQATGRPGEHRVVPVEGAAASAELRSAQALARGIFGHPVQFVRLSNGPLFHGLTLPDKSGGRPTVVIDAGTPRPVMAVLGHELLHSLRMTHPAIYDALKARLDQVMKSQAPYAKKLNARRAVAGIPALSEDVMAEERIADVVGDQFTEPAFWRDLAHVNAGGFRRIADAVLSFIDDVLAKVIKRRPFGSDAYIKDMKAARAAVVDAMSEFSRSQATSSTGTEARMSIRDGAKVTLDENGNPEFTNDRVRVAYPIETDRLEVIPQEGEKVLNYAIMPASGFDVLGKVELLVKGGNPVSLLDIEVNKDARKQGTARAAVEAILAGTDGDLNISNIVDSARGFWAKLGVPEQNLPAGHAYEGTLNASTYSQGPGHDARGVSSSFGEAEGGPAAGDHRSDRQADARGEGGSGEALGGGQASEEGRFSLADKTPEQREALARAGIGPGPSLKTRIRLAYGRAVDLLRNRAALTDEFRQGTLDQFHGIKRAVERDLGALGVDQDPYIAARLANGGTSSVMRALLLHGQAQWADNGQHLEKVPDSKGLLDILAPLGDDVSDFFGWMVGNRAARLMKEGREHNFTPDQIKTLQDLAGNRRAEFVKIAGEYSAFKRSVLDIAEGAGLINSEGRKAWDHADYIPFYRKVDEKSTFSPTGRKGLAGQSSGIRTLKGGEAALNDPVENLLMNFSRLVDASLKNNAIRKTIDKLAEGGSVAVEKVGYDMAGAVIPTSQVKQLLIDAGAPATALAAVPPEAFAGMAKMWAIQAPSDPDVVRVMRDGKPEFYRVADPLLLRALTSFVPFNFPGLGAMRAFKRLLTATVTSTPDFMLRNFIRDSAATAAITRDGFNPVKSLAGIAKSFTEAGGYEDMLFAGASFQSGNINAADPQGTAVAVRRALRERGLDASSTNRFMATLLDTPAKFWEKYRHVGEAIENANREAVFEAASKAGRGTTAAAFEAKDLMDFNLRGGWAAYQMLADVLPFFNARVQGLYRLGRSDPKRLATVGMLMMAASAMLAFANDGEDWYEELPDWDKDTYWHFRIGEHHFRLPKPFELGVLFATIPERLGRSIKGLDTGKKTLSRVWANIRDQLAFDVVPQAFRPALNVAMNHDSFRDSPIETLGDEGKLPSSRYNARTSDTMRVLAQAAAPVADATGLSPKRLEYLVNGYLGTVGAYTLGFTDMVVRKLEGKPPGSTLRADDLPLVKSFYRVDPARSTVYESDLHKLREQADQVAKTLRAHAAEGDKPRVEKLKNDNAEVLAAQPVVDEAARKLSAISKARDAITADPKLTPDEKRTKIDALQLQRNALAKQVMTAPAVRATQ